MLEYPLLTDSDLIILVKKDDRRAFGEIFQRYNSLLYVHAFKKLNDREEAKDIVQDVFTSFWTRRIDLDIKSNLGGYLYTGIQYKILNLIARKKTANTYLDSLQEFLTGYSPMPDYKLREKQLFEIIEREIAALPPKMREVFELSRKEQMSHSQIADQLGISRETVKSQIKHALKILRIKLGLFVFLFLLIRY